MTKSNKEKVANEGYIVDVTHLTWNIEVARPGRLSDEQREMLSPMQAGVIDYCHNYLLDERMVELAGVLLTTNPKRLIEILEHMLAWSAQDDDMQDMLQPADYTYLLDLKQFLLSGLHNGPEE